MCQKSKEETQDNPIRTMGANSWIRILFLSFTVLYYLGCLLYTLDTCINSNPNFIDDKHIIIICTLTIGFLLFIFNACLVKHKSFDFDPAYLCHTIFAFSIIFLVHSASFLLLQVYLPNHVGRGIINVLAISCAVLILLSIIGVLEEYMYMCYVNLIGDEEFESRSFRQFSDPNNQNQDNKEFNVMDSPYPWAYRQPNKLHVMKGSCDWNNFP